MKGNWSINEKAVLTIAQNLCSHYLSRIFNFGNAFAVKAKRGDIGLLEKLSSVRNKE